MIKDIAIYLFIMVILVSVVDYIDPLTACLVATGAFVWLIAEAGGRWRP